MVLPNRFPCNLHSVHWRYGIVCKSYCKHIILTIHFFTVLNCKVKVIQLLQMTPFTTVKAMGDDMFYHLTQVSAKEHCSKEIDWGDKIVDEIVSGVYRKNYYQVSLHCCCQLVRNLQVSSTAEVHITFFQKYLFHTQNLTILCTLKLFNHCTYIFHT